MIKTRLIPSLLLRNGRCVKTVQFDKTHARDTGDPIKSAKIYDAQGADELLFLDIEASTERHEILFDIIRHVAEECFMPLAVGGGIKTIEHIREILKIGADKVAICSAAVESPDFISKASNTFGASTILGVISFRTVGGKHKAFIHGKEKETDWEVLPLAKELEKRGAGELLLYSIDRDGMMDGYDLEIIRQVADAISIPLIACGGAGNLDDFVKVVREGHAAAVSAASIFHFTDQNLIKARAHMKNRGLNVRSV